MIDLDARAERYDAVWNEPNPTGRHERVAALWQLVEDRVDTDSGRG
jgi:hypothetical protein